MRSKGKAKRLISPLSIRILLIMLLPLVLFFIGILVVDRYRIVLIDAELNALKRQGETLARSLAIANSEMIGTSQNNNPSQIGLNPSTLRHILPLVGYGSALRARIYQPDGQIMADTAKNQLTDSVVQMTVKNNKSIFSSIKYEIISSISKFSYFVNGVEELPIINSTKFASIKDVPALGAAMTGRRISTSWRTTTGQLMLGVALPIQEVRVVRGALLLTKNGAEIESEIENVQWAFFLLLCAIFLLTIILGLYLSRSITRPIVQLAASARQVAEASDKSIRLAKLPDRKDEIGELSHALQEMTDDLQERIKATAGFAADVAHELKNPLTSLRSAAETVSRIHNPAQQKDLMAIILEDVNRLDRLINDISQASRIEAELAQSEREKVAFFPLLDSWISMMKDRYPDIRFNWQPSIEDDDLSHAFVNIHTGRIIQILDNLLVNAISFNPNDKSIDLEIKPCGNANDRICFSIRDYGIGIPEAKLDAIFNRFYSQRPKSEAFGQHSGLGLSIARQIAEAHGGKLYARNAPTTGAIFYLELPLIDSVSK
ncbi:HAMP domain-containing histidine kinase [Alphaproteobacteria bacterium]|nr:HAMP domain-containing histidine kinase [Alphaproteobacteria bacterium]